ncbi:tyrosine-type recombinase/integrase [Anaerosinus massiliensis]|uniref:tyrosine-type recombinase/integrase n=1 Tax=Massilibacillus massiliensis TaxID=1806837 RepID=UPI000DA6258F|nr:site-specific integrase [Massilibacillus massiliensis]
MTRRAWGEGSYDYNENLDRWRWRGYYTDLNGEKKRKEIVAKARKELKLKVKTFLQEIEDNGVDAFSNMTIEKWCKTWQEDVIKPSVKTRTFENYKGTCKNHIIPNFGKIKLKELQVMPIQQFLNDLCETHAVSSVLTIRNHFIILLNAAIEYGYIKNNVAKRTKPPRRVKSEINALTDIEINKLLNVAKEGSYIFYGAKQTWIENEGMLYLRNCYYAVVLLAVTTGMRQGEIFGLRWENVNLEQKVLSVKTNMVTSAEKGQVLDTPKTLTSKRNILLPKKTVETLREWQLYQKKYAEKWGDIFTNSHQLVFTNSFGKMVSVTNFTKRYFRKMLRSAGISDNVTFHILRHSFTTQLLKNGVNVNIIAGILGHSNTSVTMDIYAHILPDMQEIAVKELEKLY